MGVRGKLALDVGLFAAYLMASDTALTGIPIHEWLSLGIAVAIALHVALNWDWTVGVLSRFARRLLSLSRFNLIVDVVLFVMFVSVMVSGLLVSKVVMPVVGIEVPFGPMWRILHSLTAMFTLPVLGVHVGLHGRWFVTAFGQLLAGAPKGLQPLAIPVAISEEDERKVVQG